MLFHKLHNYACPYPCMHASVLCMQALGFRVCVCVCVCVCMYNLVTAQNNDGTALTQAPLEFEAATKI